MGYRRADGIAFILSAVIYCLFCFIMPAIYPDILKESGKTIEVLITPGMSAQNAAAAIEKAGIIDDRNALVMWMERLGIDRNIKPGSYALRRGSAFSVARQIMDAKPKSVAITIIPGMRYHGILSVLSGVGFKTDSLERALANDENFPKEIKQWLPASPRARIMFLMPDTYFLSPGEAALEQLVRLASRLWFERVGKKIDPATDKKRVFERGVLASLVENEAKVSEDRPVLAGVFLNRLNKNMRLQSCATVVYCWEEKGVKKAHLTYKDLRIDSPYNTYISPGLPPGPISVPSAESWESALNPRGSEYLFFFALRDGRHVFSRTYEEHLQRQKEINQ